MISKCIDCESSKDIKYYRVIHTEKEYQDGRRFPLNEVVVANNKVDLTTDIPKKIGGFCISTYEYIFRWLIRGDTLCEVAIPDDTKIYKTNSKNGIYVANKMILRNPRKIDDEFAMELYKITKLDEIALLQAMTVCAICGYINTAMQVCKDVVNKENIDIAINEFNEFCKRREEEHYIDNPKARESVQILENKLLEIKNNEVR